MQKCQRVRDAVDDGLLEPDSQPSATATASTEHTLWRPCNAVPSFTLTTIRLLLDVEGDDDHRNDYHIRHGLRVHPPSSIRSSVLMVSTPHAGLRALPLLLVALLICLTQSASAIKFNIPAARYPPSKCVWNAAHPGALVIITANVGPGEGQRLDIEVVDSSEHRNIYLSKKGISGEKRFAITAHAEEDIGICFRNYLEAGEHTFHRARASI